MTGYEALVRLVQRILLTEDAEARARTEQSEEPVVPEDDKNVPTERDDL